MRENKKKILKMSLIILLTVASFMGLMAILLILAGPDSGFLEVIEFYISGVIVLYGMCMIVFLSIIFAFSSGKRIAGEEAAKIDFDNEMTYYRDVVEQYSILELAYLNHMTTLKDKDLAAALLGLELKKSIKFQDNKVININTNNRLLTNETYLLGKISQGKLNIDNVKCLTKIVETDAANRGLIRKRTLKNKIKDIIIMFAKTSLYVAFTGLLYLTLEVLLNYPLDTINIIIILILGLITLGFFIFTCARGIYLISYIYHKINSYELTEKGKEIKFKLDGLKWYIKDFSNLHDNEKETLLLWEDYLIYSVMFGYNKVVMKEMKDMMHVESTIKIKTSSAFFLAIIIIIALFIFIV